MTYIHSSNGTYYKLKRRGYNYRKNSKGIIKQKITIIC